MKFKHRKLIFAYIIPIIAALVTRIFLYINWWDSPVRWYCKISGLDMQTVLGSGQWLYNGEGVFALYRALLTLILLLNNETPSPEAIIAIQFLGGIIIAPLTAWCVLRIWGKTYWACISGLLAGLYAPALMYQSLVLKESILLFFALVSLAAVLYTHKKHFSKCSLWICGILLALACICRINALPFCGMASLWIIFCLYKKYRKCHKKVIISTLYLTLGILTIFIPVSITNACLTKGSYFLPVQAKISYVTRLGSAVKPVDMTVSVQNTSEENSQAAKAGNFVINMFRKLPAVFSASEIPNNVNYYFLKYKLPPLEYLAGPLLLIPLAVTAMLILIFNRGFLRKESILFVFIFSYMLPLCYFLPLARYRLVMTPVFCMLAPYPVFLSFRAWKQKKYLRVSAPFVLLAIVFYLNFPLKNFLRATDFVSYGKGIEFKTGKSVSSLPYFYEAYKIAPYKQMTVINFSDALLKNGKAGDAAKVLMSAFKKSPSNPAYRYYLGLASLYTGKARQAEKLFSGINPDSMIGLEVQYYFYYGESLRLQKKFDNAIKLYLKAMESNPNKTQLILLRKSLKACNGK
jgi:tetratricopeptide (TPR) repeat protein